MLGMIIYNYKTIGETHRYEIVVFKDLSNECICRNLSDLYV